MNVKWKRAIINYEDMWKDCANIDDIGIKD